MINEHMLTKPACDSEVGISKLRSTDVVFDDIRRDFHKSSQIFPQKVYKLHRWRNVTNQNMKRKKDDKFVDVIRDIRLIVDRVNLKRNQLNDLMLSNPYLRYYEYGIMIVRLRFLSWGLLIFGSHDSTHGCCYSFFVDILLGLVFASLYISALATVFSFGFLLDCVTLKILSCRGSPSELDWFSRLFDDHPELQTTALDEEVKQGLYQISIRCKEKYDLDLLPFNSIETARVGAIQIHEDQFLLLEGTGHQVTPPPPDLNRASAPIYESPLFDHKDGEDDIPVAVAIQVHP